MPLTPPPSAPPASPDAPGTAPSRGNPSTFRALADAFVVWQVGFRNSIADLRTWLAGYISWAATHVSEIGALQTDVSTKASQVSIDAGQVSTDASTVAGIAAAFGNVDSAVFQAGEARTDAQAAAVSASGSAASAQSAKTQAEAARDSANTSARAYTAAQGTAAALADAAVLTGQTFAVVAVDLQSYAVYRKDAGPVATPMFSQYTKAYIDAFGLQDQPVSETGLTFGITDQNGRRLWLEAGLDGGPTAYALGKIGAALTPGNTPELANAGQVEISAENDIAVSIVDQNDRRTELEVGKDGKFTQRVIDSLAARIMASVRGVSGPDIACVGDSLTAGSGSPVSYPSVLATLTGRTVWNLGVGGETSATIAGRAGGRPWLATVSGGTIPASGAVTVTLTLDDGTVVAPLQQGSSGVNPCVIAGVTGTLSFASGTYTFSRQTAGSAVSVNFPAPVLTDAWANRRGDIYVMWWGQNDGTNDASEIIARQRATVEGLKPMDKRWLVIGLTTSSAAFRAPMEAQFYREFGRRFVNLRQYLSSDAAMADAGLVPTSTDLAQMSSGQVPDSLRSDATHLNQAGYTRAANFIYARLLELGFI